MCREGNEGKADQVPQGDETHRPEGGDMITIPYAPRAADPAETRPEPEHRFPAIPLWFGTHTGHWWALVDDRLVEAETPEALGEAITAALGGERWHDPAPPHIAAGALQPRRSAGSWQPTATSETFTVVEAPTGLQMSVA